ncbi:MAG: XdhC family protein [Actinomycetota bacterium]|nr:XdhC family protein [Actinomycetota bacterium]
MTGWDVLREAGELARAGEAFAVATVVWRQGPSSGQLGSRAIISAAGEVRGWIGGACAQPTVIREARQAIADGQPRLLLLGTGDQFGGAIPAGMTVVPISCQSEGALEVYVEPVLPAPHLMIVGSTPMTRALADLAGVIGWRAEIRDGTEFTAADVDGRSMVVVATQGHGDEEALEQAVTAGPAYVGLVGSHRRGAAVLGYLAERGVPADQLDRVRVPAGLDLGPTPHVEIAVAILAELVRLRAAGTIPAGLPAGTRAGSGTEPAAETAEATDPVCGMTVSADTAGRPLDYQGVTYYFCCAGCRGAFESDPAAYARKETRC